MAFSTSFAPQVIGENGYTILPLVTIGETLSNTTGALNSTTAGDYQPVGILDGMGAIRLDSDTVRAFTNHELVDNDGIAYTLTQGTADTSDDYTLTGGRISYFDININTLQIEDAGLAYNTIVGADGNVATSNSVFGQTFADPFGDRTQFRDFEGFSRFCSGGLAEAEQFGTGRGLADNIYFAGEETGGAFAPLGVGTGVWMSPPERCTNCPTWLAVRGKTPPRLTRAQPPTLRLSWRTTSLPSTSTVTMKMKARRSISMWEKRTPMVTSWSATV